MNKLYEDAEKYANNAGGGGIILVSETTSSQEAPDGVGLIYGPYRVKFPQLTADNAGDEDFYPEEYSVTVSDLGSASGTVSDFITEMRGIFTPGEPINYTKLRNFMLNSIIKYGGIALNAINIAGGLDWSDPTAAFNSLLSSLGGAVAGGEVILCDAEGNPIDIKDTGGGEVVVNSDEDFFIYVPTKDAEAIEKLPDVTLTYHSSYGTVASASIFYHTENGKSFSSQWLARFNTDHGENQNSVTLHRDTPPPTTTPDNPSVTITIDKKDDNGTPLEGAVFAITATCSTGTVTGVGWKGSTYTSGVKFDVNKDGDSIHVSIVEVLAPNGFARVEGTIELDFTYSSDGTLTCTTPIGEGTGVPVEVRNVATVDGAKAEATVEIADKPCIAEIAIDKTDFYDNLDVDATFKMTITNVRSLYLEKSIGNVEKLEADTSTYTIEVDQIEMKPHATLWGADAFSGILIRNAVIQDEGTPVTITLEELEVGKGYTKLKKPIIIELSNFLPTPLGNKIKINDALDGAVSTLGSTVISTLKGILSSGLSKFGFSLGSLEALTYGLDYQVRILHDNIYYDPFGNEYKLEYEMTTNENGEDVIAQDDDYNDIMISDGKFKNCNGKEMSLVENHTEFDLKDFFEDPLSGVSIGGKCVKITVRNIPKMNVGGYVMLNDFGGDYKARGVYRNHLIPFEDVLIYLYDAQSEQLITQDVYGNEITNPFIMGETIVKDKEGNDISLNDGQYLFPNVEARDYKVVFEYEGLKYIIDELYDDGQYKNVVKEIDRPGFNAKYNEIKGAGSISSGTSSGGVGITYDIGGEIPRLHIGGEDVAVLSETDNATNFPTESIFAMYEVNYAEYILSKEWRNTWEDAGWRREDGDGPIDFDHKALNIDAILQDRIFDLSLAKDLYNAEVTINGKATLYDYDEIIDNKIQDDANRYVRGTDKSNSGAYKYALGIYLSDYKYRILSYFNKSLTYPRDVLDENTGLYNKDKDNKRDESTYGTDVKDPNAINELEIYVTYKIVLTNQSFLDFDTAIGKHGKNAVNVTGVADYYDAKYEKPQIRIVSLANNSDNEVQIYPTPGTGEEDPFMKDPSDPDKAWEWSQVLPDGPTQVIDGKEYKKLEINTSHKIDGVDLGSNDDVDTLNTEIIYVRFHVCKDEDGNVLINRHYDDTDNTKDNIAEITSYKTTNGLIDKDSAPDNCATDGSLHYEDDTDVAESFNIYVRDDKRQIFGKVYDADTGEPVDDVIVELIELKEKDLGNVNPDDPTIPMNDVFEYIWQQTRSGGEYVDRMHIIDLEASEEPGIDHVENSIAMGPGEYMFEDFIPGNYIIRFIYGDGRVNYVDENGKILSDNQGLGLKDYNNIRKYNGQDYKSLEYVNYNSEKLYNDVEGIDTPKNYSVARDNEARRLETMAYSTVVDGAKATAMQVVRPYYDEDGNVHYKAFEDLTDQEKANLIIYYNSEIKKKGAADINTLTKAQYEGEKYKESGNYEIGIIPRLLNNTWMCAETLTMNVPVDSDELQGLKDDDTEVDKGTTPKDDVIFSNVNLGIKLREKTKLFLEKHVTSLSVITESKKILLDATANILDILDDESINSNDKDVKLKGVTKGLTTIVANTGIVDPGFKGFKGKVTPTGVDHDANRQERIDYTNRSNRGFWKLETDLSELGQGSELFAKYTYVVNNVGETDFLSKNVVQAYRDNEIAKYSSMLKKDFKDLVLQYTLVGINKHTGDQLGQYYYTGKIGSQDRPVPTKATEIQEAVNNKFAYVDGDFEIVSKDNDKNSAYVIALEGNAVNAAKNAYKRNAWKDDGKTGVLPPWSNPDEPELMNTIIKTVADDHDTQEQEGKIIPIDTKSDLVPKTSDSGSEINKTSFKKFTQRSDDNILKENVLANTTNKTEYIDLIELGYNSYIDARKKVKLRATVTTEGGSYDSNIAEITQYTNAAGRIDMEATPSNLAYVHSDDTKRTLDSVPGGAVYADEKPNEHDEFWGETIIISKPTGEDKLTPVQITLICTAGIAVIGVGIVLIKKFVIKK